MVNFVLDFVRISRGNTLEYCVNRYRHPISQNPIHNSLGRSRVLRIEKNTLKFRKKVGINED
jgi:hypothetical protein